ncbi:MAG: hypothetical protein DSZ24_04275 [Thermodesulfatator sp.]|nr:MAG: hypothetical protein DSZ24_04275 [Thermodesulfatator sp.]
MSEELARRNRLLILVLSVALAFLAGFGLGYLPTQSALTQTRLELSLCRVEKGRCEREREALAAKQEKVVRLLEGLKSKDGKSALSALKILLEVLK